MKILFASQNINKQKEAEKLFGDTHIELSFPEDFPEVANFDPDEPADTFQENALIKAQAYAHKIDMPVIADDSGVIIDGMNGLPGVHSNRWFPGSPDDRNAEVLRRLAEPTSDGSQKTRSARYITVACFYDPTTEEYITTTATQAGSIADTAFDGEGFAYDKIFIPAGETQTFAVLGDDFKNQNSQRARAYRQLAELLKKRLVQDS